MVYGTIYVAVSSGELLCWSVALFGLALVYFGDAVVRLAFFMHYTRVVGCMSAVDRGAQFPRATSPRSTKLFAFAPNICESNMELASCHPFGV